jgi:hypothetical protein
MMDEAEGEANPKIYLRFRPRHDIGQFARALRCCSNAVDTDSEISGAE